MSALVAWTCTQVFTKTVDGFGQDARHGGLASAAWTGEQVSMTHALGSHVHYAACSPRAAVRRHHPTCWAAIFYRGLVT